MKKMLPILAMVALIATVSSCKTKVKDADVKAGIETVLAANPDYSAFAVDVKDGVATITGIAKDDATKAAVESAVKAIKGVKSVNNNTTVAPPVVISADDLLLKGVTDALKDFPSVQATVNDGVISLTGETTKANWVKIKAALDALNPKKTDPAGLTIK